MTISRLRFFYFLGALPLLLGFGPASCSSKEKTWRENDFKTRDLSRVASEVKLPRKLWEEIEDVGRVKVEASGGGGHGGGGESAGGHGSSRKTSVVTVFAPLNVYLVEKNPGILKGGNTKVEFGPGGGEIDLRDFVETRNGSFYFVAEFVPDLKDVSPSVFYLSNAVTRKIGSETYGAGCGTFFNVSQAFGKASRGQGFLVNTTEGRHIAALAGHYFFAAHHEGKLYLASLTIQDADHRKWQCPPREPAKKELLSHDEFE